MTKCELFLNILSPAVHTLLPLVLQRLDYHGIEALILILVKVLKSRYDLIIHAILLPSQVFFSCRGTESSQMVPNQEKMEGGQGRWLTSSKPQSCTAAIATTDLCAGALSWWYRTVTPFVCLPGRSRNVSSTTFQSPELLIQCGFICNNTMQLVLGKVEFNAC